MVSESQIQIQSEQVYFASMINYHSVAKLKFSNFTEEKKMNAGNAFIQDEGPINHASFKDLLFQSVNITG